MNEHEPQPLETEPCAPPSVAPPSSNSDHFARKADRGKANYALLPPEAWALRLTPDEREGVVRVLEFGAKKYAPHSWANVPDGLERYRAAAQRHREAMARGERDDTESSLPHYWHFLCCVIFVFALETKAVA